MKIIKTDPGKDVKVKSSLASADEHALDSGKRRPERQGGKVVDLERFIVAADQVFDELIAYHRKRVASFAARINPRLTPDDLLNPHDFEELENNGHFQYEDGVLNGCIAAQAALRRFFAEQLATDADQGTPEDDGDRAK